MPSHLHIAVEAHATSATLYLSGTLSAADATRIGSVCADLPCRPSILCADLRGVTRHDTAAFVALLLMLHRWRTTSGGNSRWVPPIAPPPTARSRRACRDSFVTAR